MTRPLVVVGGSSGIGEALVIAALADTGPERGARILVVDRHAPSERIAPDVAYVPATLPQDVPAVAAAMREWLGDDRGPIRLFLPAGITSPRTTRDITPDEVEQLIGINLTAMVTLMHAVNPLLAPGSSVVLTSSVAAHRGGGYFGASTYAAAKAGVEGLARGLARELGPVQVRVNAVAPGPTRTPLLAGVPEDVITRLGNATLLRRMGEPEEIAAAVLFLLGDQASFITGATLLVDGGAAVC